MKYFVFEGPDGSGKSTQIAEVRDALSDLGYKVMTTRSPGGTPAGAAIRSVLKDETLFSQIPPLARRLLFTADRVIFNNMLTAAVRDDYFDVILCDRCEGISNRAYGTVEGCDLEEMKVTEQIGVGASVPIDRAFLFNIPVDVAWERTDHEDLADRDFDHFSAVNKVYAEMALEAHVTDNVQSIGGVSIPTTVIDANDWVQYVTHFLVDQIKAELI